MKKKVLLVISIVLALTMCKKPEVVEVTKQDIPEVTTQDVTNIGVLSATCGGIVTDDGGAEVTARGMCWSTSENPTITDCHTTDGSGTGSYTSNITGLSARTVYYVRAYATNSYGTSYGSQKNFTTDEQINGYDYVDLGLPSGLKWATCNVGASSPSEYGDYYAWGETTTKSDYSSSNCLTDGQEIGDISGNPQYDAARANWGSTWRMPTKSEFEELIKECEWEWTSEGENDRYIDGYRVTGPNGNSIFLPAAGSRYGTSLYYAGSYGDYWSSTPYEIYSQLAYDLYFYSVHHGTGWYSRYYGQSVRPVSE